MMMICNSSGIKHRTPDYSGINTTWNIITLDTKYSRPSVIHESKRVNEKTIGKVSVSLTQNFQLFYYVEYMITEEKNGYSQRVATVCRRALRMKRLFRQGSHQCTSHQIWSWPSCGLCDLVQGREYCLSLLLSVPIQLRTRLLCP